MPEDNLEQILEAFDQVKEVFHSPRTLSYEHDDVTVKYWNSMLKMTEDETQKELMVTSFCERFDANQEQMEDLLSDQHNWIEYNLYHTFSAHCQQKLRMDTETFWQGVADITFQDHGDEQIKSAVGTPLPVVILGMNIQFRNWSKVNKIKVKSLKRSRHSYVIRKKTLPEAQERTEQLVGKEVLETLLRRDDLYTHHSFTTTFQKLYNQPNLYLELGQSEVDGNEWSEHFVHPTGPRKLKGFEKYYSFLVSLKNFRRNLKRYFLPWSENKRLRDGEFKYEQTLSESKRYLELANAKLDRTNEELQSRQDLIVSLLGSISKLRFSSDRHAIRNYLSTTFENEKNSAVEQMAQQICLAYALVKNDVERSFELATQHLDIEPERYSGLTATLIGSDLEQGTEIEKAAQYLNVHTEDLSNIELVEKSIKELTYLKEATQPFGIGSENLVHKENIENILHKVIIDKDSPGSKEVTTEEDDLAAFFGEEKEIMLEEAYKSYLAVRDVHKDNPETKQIAELNFFRQFYSLKKIREVIDYVNEKLSSVGEINFDKLNLSEAMVDAIKNAEKEKGADLELIAQLDYDPLFTTDRATLVKALTELCYNSIEHGRATAVTLTAHRPTKKEEEEAGTLPYMDQFSFDGGYPQAYICFTDNGQGMPEEKAEQLNRYLSGESHLGAELSSREKEEGGMGTSNLNHFLRLHKGQCFYESGEGTKVHIYLEKLNI